MQCRQILFPICGVRVPCPQYPYRGDKSLPHPCADAMKLSLFLHDLVDPRCPVFFGYIQFSTVVHKTSNENVVDLGPQSYIVSSFDKIFP